MSYIFTWLGFFLLPFENLKIAPSAGWPAIAPMFFFAAFLTNKEGILVSYKAGMWLLLAAILSCIGWVVSFFVESGNRFFFRDVASAFPTLILGYAFYQATCNEVIHKNKFLITHFRKLVNAFVLGSFIALLISFVILVFTHILRYPNFINFLEYVLKRNYDNARFSFLFAEPSFVSVHILGVIVPFIWLTSKLHLHLERKKLIYLLLVYILIAIFYSKSARFLLDIVALLSIFLLLKFISYRKNVSNIQVLFVLLVSIVLSYAVLTTPWIIEALTLGRVNVSEDIMMTINSDPSLASRYFRIDAVLNAIYEHPITLLAGVGFGNVGYLIDIGFNAASQNFHSFYTTEIYRIYEQGSGPNIFSMYARFIGEFGIIAFGFILLKLYDKRLIFLFLVLGLCYMQFDSYAFYGIWIYIFIKRSQQLKLEPGYGV